MGISEYVKMTIKDLLDLTECGQEEDIYVEITCYDAKDKDEMLAKQFGRLGGNYYCHVRDSESGTALLIEGLYSYSLKEDMESDRYDLPGSHMTAVLGRNPGMKKIYHSRPERLVTIRGAYHPMHAFLSVEEIG